MFNSLSRFVGVITLAFAAGLGAQQSNSASPRELLKQYVAELKKDVAGQLDCQRVSTTLRTACETLGKIDRDNEGALREKIIKLANTLQPLPEIPEEARRHFVKADTLARDAHAPADFPPAIDEYQQALALAPWWADAYHDLALVLETAGKFEDAKKNLHFYLLTKPTDKEARAAQDEIYKIEAKQQESAKRAADEAAKAQEIARAQATRFAGKWNQQGGDRVLIITGSQGNYSCRVEPPSWPMSLNGRPNGGRGHQEVSKCDVSGTRLSLEIVEGADFPGLYHNQWTESLDLYISNDSKQLTGSSATGSNRKEVMLVRAD